MTSTNFGPGTPYGRPGAGGWTWNPDANETWARDHSIDPRTGMISGPFPLPPADLARGYQALHDRAIFGLRQRMMQGGINYAQGALGLLQSFRPGGSAALEAGVYQNLSGMMFQRAAMTQPLDLMSDLRRHEAAIAQQNANRARERQTYVQIGQMLATVAGGYLGGGAGLAAGFLANIGASAAGGIMARETAVPTAMGGMTGGVGGAAAGAMQGYANAMQQMFPSDGGTQSQGSAQQPQQQQVAPLQGQGMGAGSQQQQQQPGAMQSQLDVPGAGQDPGAMQQQQQMQQQRQMGGAAGGMGGGIGAGMPTPGADGNFTGQSFAAASAMGAAQSGASPVERLVMTNYVADLREADPFFRTLGFTINSMWANTMRLTA